MCTLVISDVHANAAALAAVLAAEAAVDRVVFLGDAVDLGPRPAAVVAALRSVADVRVSGNHDRLVLDADPAVDPDDEYERWRQWTRSALSESAIEFLETAPRTTAARLGGRRVRLHHGDFDPPDGIDAWTTRTTPAEAPDLFEAVAGRYDEDTVVLGHSHRPFVAEVAGTTFVNPGSVGLQRDDARPDVARYAVVVGDEFELRSVEYDVASVVDAVDDLPLPAAFLASWVERFDRASDG